MTRDQVDEYYLTVAEVAELLRLNQQTVRNWIDQGSLPALRVGRRVRIKQSDLDRLLSEGYSAGAHVDSPGDGPSAEDFWGGEPVGVAESAVAIAEPDAGAAEPTADVAEPAQVTARAAAGVMGDRAEAGVMGDRAAAGVMGARAEAGAVGDETNGAEPGAGAASADPAA